MLAHTMTRFQGCLLAATSGLLLSLAVMNLVINTFMLGSWLPLMLTMIYPFVLGIANIRHPRISAQKDRSRDRS